MSTTVAPQVSLALRNVLVATDFSPCSERALLHAVAAAHHFGSTLHLVHVVQSRNYCLLPPDAYIGTPDAISLAIQLAREDAQRRLSDVLHRTHCDDLKSRIWLKASTSVGDTIRALVESEHIDLAVLGTHGRTGLRRMILGSVAEDVFRHASCPVLTVGPHSWSSDPQAVRLKHVLFPTDLSADSARALAFAMAVASEFSAAFTVLTIIERLDGEAALDRSRVFKALKDRMREMVCAAGPMPPQIAFEVEVGEVADTVVETAARLGVDLITFGLKPPDSFMDRLPWMHAYKVICEARCPVLSLRGVPASRFME
jgi:nucleotide-binding universal stress UspA family protein